MLVEMSLWAEPLGRCRRMWQSRTDTSCCTVSRGGSSRWIWLGLFAVSSFYSPLRSRFHKRTSASVIVRAGPPSALAMSRICVSWACGIGKGSSRIVLGVRSTLSSTHPIHRDVQSVVAEGSLNQAPTSTIGVALLARGRRHLVAFRAAWIDSVDLPYQSNDLIMTLPNRGIQGHQGEHS